MNVKATVLRTEMGRRSDDFTSEIIDTAIVIRDTAGLPAAELYLDENLIDFDVTRRVLFAPSSFRRSADTASLVKFETISERRRFFC